MLSLTLFILLAVAAKLCQNANVRRSETPSSPDADHRRASYRAIQLLERTGECVREAPHGSCLELLMYGLIMHRVCYADSHL